MSTKIEKLRSLALSQTFFQPTTLKGALNKMQFVQADPIRSPARAQDLILRHRVKDYKAGDIEKQYPALSLEEDYLYAYGYLTRGLGAYLHPKKVGRLTQFDKKVLKSVSKLGQVNSKNLKAHFGTRRVTNWWGGYSQATKQALDRLHYWGLVRVAGRQNGVKLYEKAASQNQDKSLSERKKQIVLSVVKILAPVTEGKLTQALHFTKRLLGDTKKELAELLAEGILTKQSIENVTYIWPIDANVQSSSKGVKFLAPFDPLVWDRQRFEHLWGWPYRFEAYTPANKRVRGYYAMPLLWNEHIIGWANLKLVNKKLETEFGFVKRRPTSKEFTKDLDKEIAGMKTFLGLE